MWHSRQVTDDVAAIDIPTEWYGKLLFSLGEGSRFERLPQADGCDLSIRYLKSDAGEAGNRGFNANAWRGQRQGQVTLQLGDTPDLHSDSRFQRKLGHGRPGIDFPHLGLDFETRQCLFDQPRLGMKIRRVWRDVVVESQSRDVRKRQRSGRSLFHTRRHQGP